MQETSNTITNTPLKGLITDLSENLVPKEVWTHARNAQVNSHLGQTQFLQNEPSNSLCVEIPYTVIGTIKLLNSRWAIFSTNNTVSEIGIFDEKNCTYVKLVNNTCLGFKQTNLISGVSKENFDCSETIYWTDNLNPRRFLNLSNIPYKYTTLEDECQTKVFNDKLDCEELLLDPKISVPHITPKLNFSGNLTNGVYQFALAYAVNSIRVSEFYTVTKPVRIWSHENRTQSISLELDNLDKSYDEFELGVIYTSEQATFYKSLGFYSTKIASLLVSTLNKSEYTPLAIQDFIIKRPRYPYAELVGSNDHYLLWGNLKSKPELNYQLQAMNIVTKYSVYRVPDNYYKNGGIEVGYERDETYSFGIQWLYDTGDWSPAFHIPGRLPKGGETGLASGTDVYEPDIVTNCPPEKPIKQWEVYNTASEPKKILSPTVCDESLVAEGEMAYWESEHSYPDNKDLFGDNACTPIRHHKFPDNSLSHIYANSGKNIDILGVTFENIEHPIDSKGNYLSNIVGYRIVRGDRKNNRTVIAKGIFSNVRSYNESDGTEVLYPNYPYNDLRPDTFLSVTQTQGKASKEKNFSPLTQFKTDKFNFYSPHCLFSNTSLGEEFKIYTEEIAKVKGHFREVHKHPKQKLLTQFDLYLALIIGALDGYYAQQGKKSTTVIKNNKIQLSLANGVLNSPSGPVTLSPGSVGDQNSTMEQASDDALAFTSTLSVNNKQLKPVERVLRTLARVGIFAYFTIQTAQKVLDIIANASPFFQYGLQYNSVGFFNAYKKAPKDNTRRYLEYYQYLRDGINTVEGVKFNNYKRENSVYINLHKPIDVPKTEDDSRRTLQEFGACSDINKNLDSTASMYYGAVKRKFPNQYGTLDSINYLDTGYLDTNLVHSEKNSTSQKLYKASVVFGGDTFINKLAIKRSHHYFSFFLHDVPDGYAIDYRTFRNVAYPRYWIDSQRYDLSSFTSLRPSMGRTPANKHNLSCGKDNSSGVTTVSNRYFYLFNNGVVNFFTESDYNLDLRDWRNSEPSFYSDHNSNKDYLFRSDKIEIPEEFIYDNTYSKELIENYIPTQKEDFNPELEASCFSTLKNRVIYSMPANKEQKADNWKNYLALNYYDFPMKDFGELTAMQSIDNQQIMFLFDKSSPYVTIGRDELQLDGSGKKITLGDGGLFTREPRPIAYTDYFYGNSQSKWAFVNTQFGIFYPSQRQGRIFNYTGKLNEITKNGMHYWFKNNLPSKLLQQFPNFKHKDNPVIGVSLTSVFDNTSEVFYICKKDYSLKPEFKERVTYNETSNKFFYDSIPIKLEVGDYFEDASWTISFDPKTSAFLSWHDWKPNWTMQSENHFLTIKDKGIWKHGNRYDSFCNFYGINYPFEIEYLVNNGQLAEVLRSIEYVVDAGIYYNEGRDFHQVLDYNFDYLTVHNNEQMSGNLKLVLQSKKDLTQFFDYPKLDTPNEQIHILYNKEEQKTRINQFADITKDRGEFTLRNFPLWTSNPDGYTREINQAAINYNKPKQHQKKFRGLWHKILLRKLISENNKMIFKFANSKESVSFR